MDGANDLLRGLPAVADYLGVTVRVAQNWHARELLPTFRIGNAVCARRSTLASWLKTAEQEAMARRAEGTAA